MSSSDTVYSARFPLPELIEQGRANVLKCRVERAGAPVTPSSGTITVYNAANTAIVSAAAATITGGIATYTLLAATVSGESRGEGWRIEWALAMPDSTTHTFVQDAALVRRRLAPPVTEVDLFQRVSSLDPKSRTPITSLANYQDKLDEAWTAIQLRLIERGNRPNLILSPSALRECTLELWIALIFEDLETRLNDAYGALAARARDRFEAAWSRLNFLYDESGDDGQAETTNRRPPKRSVWLGGRDY